MWSTRTLLPRLSIILCRLWTLGLDLYLPPRPAQKGDPKKIFKETWTPRALLAHESATQQATPALQRPKLGRPGSVRRRRKLPRRAKG